MKPIFFILNLFISIPIITLGQDSSLNADQKQMIENLIDVFKSKNKEKIADVINYPLSREYPLKDVKDKHDFIQRFDEIFDKDYLDHIIKSKVDDWGEVGWRGIMLDNGSIWIDDEGKIIAVNSQSLSEERMLKSAIQADKNKLPKSLQNFEKPVYLIMTRNFKIRIDEKAEGVYRYASWKAHTTTSEPELVIENGVWEFQGSGGNHTITFKNNDYTYVISINVIRAMDDPDAVLVIEKKEKTVWTESGNIIRN